jgi:hypothetical protein
MGKLVKLLILLVAALVNLPAYAQDYAQDVPTNPWQDFAPVAKSIVRRIAANQAMNQAVQQAVAPSRSNYRYSLPPTATSSVDISICDLPPKDPPINYGSTGSTNPANSNLPPAPGPGYQPIYQHGVFVGYMSPELINMMQTDPAGAWTAFANSADWAGPEGLRLSLLAETGAATPEQMAQLQQMALFGM